MSEPLSAGTEISHYRIVSILGAGGMGAVYLADDTRLGRRVALKLLLDDVSNDLERVERFVREARAASALNHPNILTVFEIGTTADEKQFIATEYIEGKTLRHLAAEGGIDLDTSLSIAIQAATALSAAHRAGILHRDIKPDNIMVRDDKLVKVLDFGLAKLSEPLGSSPSLAASEDATRHRVQTLPGTIMGTVAYMSPEQARGRTLDARTDIFSFGVVLYELLTGRQPFEGESNADVISAILKSEPAPLSSIVPDLPRQLERIVEKTLRKDRELRYQLMRDLEIDLADLQEELRFDAKRNRTSRSTVLPAPTETVPARTSFTESFSATRRFTLLHALLFAGVAAAAILTLLYFQWGKGAATAKEFHARELTSWVSAPGELFGTAHYSPDGKMIAFASTRSGTKNIWVMQSTSRDAIQVTNDAFSNKDPIWSPNGDEIAYFSQKPSAAGIWRVSALGGGTPRFVGAVSDGSFELARWSPSGKIYYRSDNALFAMDLNSGAAEKVASFDPAEGKLAWIGVSPDEKKTAFLIEKGAGAKIFESDLAASARTQVAEINGDVSGIAWDASSGRFFYSGVVEGVFQVFSVTRSSKPVELTDGGTDEFVLDAAGGAHSLIISAAREDAAIWRVGLDGKSESAVARTINAELWPSVSPNGGEIAFQTAKNLSRGANLFSSEIFLRRLDGRDEAGTRLVEQGFLPVFSPNGNAIAFLKKNTEDAFELRLVNPNGGGDRVIASGGIPAIGYSVSPYNQIQTQAFAWSHDSTHIDHVAVKDGVPNIYSVNVADGHSDAVTKNTASDVAFYCPIFSPDGSKLAYYSQKRSAEPNGQTLRSINVVDLATGSVKNVWTSAVPFRLLNWMSDDALLVAEAEAASSLPPATIIRRIGLDGKAAETATLKDAYFYNIFVSPDRTMVAFAARTDAKDDIWTIKTSGGEPRRLTANNDRSVYYSRIAWLPDSSGILFGKQSRFNLLSVLTDSAEKGE